MKKKLAILFLVVLITPNLGVATVKKGPQAEATATIALLGIFPQTLRNLDNLVKEKYKLRENLDEFGGYWIANYHGLIKYYIDSTDHRHRLILFWDGYFELRLYPTFTNRYRVIDKGDATKLETPPKEKRQ